MYNHSLFVGWPTHIKQCMESIMIVEKNYFEFWGEISVLGYPKHKKMWFLENVCIGFMSICLRP